MDVFLGSAIGSLIGYCISLLIQERKYKYDLSMVAMEKRLDAHQKAYTLFFDIKNYPSGDPLEIYGRGVKFLRDYALYLTVEAEEAIQVCLDQLNKCAHLNDRPEELVKELEVLEGQGEVIRKSLSFPKIRLSSLNSRL